jgi:RNA polymerase sigma factor (sigma-70 family)
MNKNELFEKNTQLVYEVYHEKLSHIPHAGRFFEDLIQIGMLALWKAAQGYDENHGIKFSTYAYTAIYHNMMNYLHKEGRHCSLFISLDNPLSSEEVTTYLDTKAIQVICGNDIEIMDVLRRLPEEDQHLVALLACGYTQKEIGKIFGDSQPMVYRKIKKLRKVLKDTLFFED